MMELCDLTSEDGTPLDHLTEVLRRQGVVSLAHLLEQPRLELLHTTRLWADDLERVVLAAARKVLPNVRTAATLRAASVGQLRTGLPTLDEALGGGLAFGAVTEVSGNAGSGKTQLCLHLAARVVLADGDAHAVYVDTERSFCAQRLEEMLLALAGWDDADTDATDAPLRTALARVHVVQPLSSRQLSEALDAIGAVAGGSTRVALVVLDSVGALVRAEFDRDARFRRVEHLAALAATLKRIATALGAAVLVSNQIVGIVGEDERRVAGSNAPYGRGEDGRAVCGELEGAGGTRLQPSLGVSWAHNVNYRLLFDCVDAPRTESGAPQAADGRSAMRRCIRVEKSPRSAQAAVEVSIGLDGLAELAGAGAHAAT